MRLLGALCAFAFVLTLAPGRAAAWQCVKDIRDAGPDGRLCTGSTGPGADGNAAAPTVAPAAGSLLTGAAGVVGGLLGAGLVQPLPPLPPRPKIKPLTDDENADDPSVRKGVQAARDLLGDDVGKAPKPRSKNLPPPASRRQVDAVVSELKPFRAFDRTDARTTARGPVINGAASPGPRAARTGNTGSIAAGSSGRKTPATGRKRTRSPIRRSVREVSPIARKTRKASVPTSETGTIAVL